MFFFHFCVLSFKNTSFSNWDLSPIFLFKYFHIIKVFVRICYKIQVESFYIPMNRDFLAINALHYFQVFYYLVWVARNLGDFDSPSPPFLDHFLLCSIISVASIQPYRPTIKNQIFNRVYDSPSYGYVRSLADADTHTAKDLAQLLVQRFFCLLISLCLKHPRIYRPRQ